MKVVVFLVIFFLLGAFFIISNNELMLSKNEERTEFVNIYKEWVASIIDNTGSITSNAVKLDWLPKPENSSRG